MAQAFASTLLDAERPKGSTEGSTAPALSRESMAEKPLDVSGATSTGGRMTAQHQVRVRLSLPPDLHAKLMALPPGVRSQAVSTVLAAVLDGIDLPHVITFTEQARKLGVLLNQSLHYCYTGGNFDARRVTAVVDFIERLRVPFKRR